MLYVDYYLPGYRAGGPMRTIENLVECLGDELEFLIVCSDRDLGDAKPYPEMAVDCWVTVGKAKVYYASPRSQTFFSVLRLMRDTQHDVVYLNSAFSLRFSLLPLFARKFCRATNKPLIVAPRGEFGAGALALKAAKKRVFLFFAKITKLYAGTLWQASSEHEAADIARVLHPELVWAGNTPPLNDICVACDLAKVARTVPAVGVVVPGEIRLIFLSRVVAKKNLAFAIDVMRRVSAKATLNIVGPLEDGAYWGECQRLIAGLPGNVAVEYKGEALPAEVPGIMAAHDVFFLPTKNENFGHVIAEALSASVPVLISDQTPWRGLAKHSAGWDLPLDAPEAFAKIIDEFSQLPAEKRGELREAARRFARERLEDPAIVAANRELFYRATGRAAALVAIKAD